MTENISIENLLQASFDSMLDLQAVLEAVRDPSGQIVDFVYRSANRAAYAYMGLSKEELLGRNQSETTPNFRETGLEGRYIRCLQDGRPVVITDFPYSSDALTGDRRYDICATKVGVDQICVTWRDVTKRYRTAEDLADAAELNRLLVENLTDVVCHIREGKFAWVSPSIESVLGAPPEYWLGRALIANVPPEDLADQVAWMGVVSEGGTVKRRMRVLGVDGVARWLDLHAKPFYSADGQLDGAAASLRLVDEQVAAELQLQDTRQRLEDSLRQQARADALYRRSMDSAAVGMCLVKPDATIVEVNAALCELLGYDAVTLKEMTWRQLTAPEYVGANEKNVHDLLEGRIDSYRMRKQFIHADGHRIWGDLSVSCIRDQNGQVEIIMSQIIDVTVQVTATERSNYLAERLAAELASAASYMADIMPHGLTGEPAVSSLYLPARELGGDCFDYAWIDDDHLMVYLFDVSGHGIEPALLAVSLHNLLRSGSFTTEALMEPRTVLNDLNRLFQMERQQDHYFTMWFGVYEASTRMLRYASAGAPPAVAFNYVSGTTVALTELSTHSTPIGMFGNTVFDSSVYKVPPGCRILVHSDGVSEVNLADGGLLSFESFTGLVAKLGQSPDWSIDALMEELRALTPSGNFEDDCSIIQMKFD